MQDNNITHLPSPRLETPCLTDSLEFHDGQPIAVTVRGHRYPIVGLLSQMGFAPQLQPGDTVLVSEVEGGVIAHGVITPTGSASQASMRIEDGRLIIEAQGAITLKSGDSTIELTETGIIRINGKKIRGIGEERIDWLGGSVSIN